MSETGSFSAFMKKQGISITFDRICIKALGAMAHGLFASLLIGTIIKTIGQNVPALAFMVDYGNYASAVTGAAMACSIGYALQCPPFVLYSLLAVGGAANTLGGAGGPLAVFFIALIAIFAGKLVSKTTPVDLIVTPFVTIMVGVFAATILAPPIGTFAIWLGKLIYMATNLQPFLMGIIVSASMGIILTLPISSAAVCAALGLVGLAGGAAVAGCCAHMVGFAVASYRENKVGGLLAQGIGTSMLQVPNLMKKPILWMPAVVASIVNGPIATCVFKLKMNGAPISSGMGTSGLVGQIGVWSGWLNPSEAALAFGEVAISPTAFDWIGLIVVSFVIPAIVAWLTSEFMRKKGMIVGDDLKIDC